MNEILLEKKIILVSTRTICELFDQENWSDLVALYMFYHKQCKLQGTNQSFTTSDFAMKWLWWWDKRFKNAKKSLKELRLIEDITTRNDKWSIEWWFIKLNYIESLNKANLTSSAETHPLGVATGCWQKTNAWSTKDINAWSTKEETEKSHIKEKKQRNKSNIGSSSIRERSLSEPFVPPEKEIFIELLWDTNWVSKYYEFFSIWKIYQSFTNEQLKELYLWMIDFFKEKYHWKIYRDEDWKMVWYMIILNELDKMIAYYSTKWRDILDLKATLRSWIVRNSEPYPFTKK